MGALKGMLQFRRELADLQLSLERSFGAGAGLNLKGRQDLPPLDIRCRIRTGAADRNFGRRLLQRIGLAANDRSFGVGARCIAAAR